MRILKYLLLGLLVLAGLVAGALWWLLGTQGGRDFVVAKVNGYTASLDTPVVLGRLTGRVLSDAGLESLTVADKQGVWLEIAGVRLVWHPMALWRGGAPFEVLEVDKVRVVRLPEEGTKNQEPGTRSGAVSPLDYLVYIPRSLKLDDVVVEAPVTGQRHRLRAEIGSGGAVQGISVTTLEGPVTTVSGTVDVVGQVLNLTMIEAPKGLLGSLLKLPEADGIQAVVQGGLQDDVVTVGRAEVKAGASRIEVRGTGALDGRMVSGTALVSVGNLRELQGLLGVSATGAVNVAGTVSGSLQALGVVVEVSRSNVLVDGVRLADLGARVSGTVDVSDMAALPFDGVLRGGVVVSGVGEGKYPLQVMVAASGTLAGFGTQVSATMVRKGERAVVVAGGSVAVSPLMGRGTVDATWVKGKDTFVAKGGVAVDPVTAVLSGLRMTGPGVVVSASGKVDMASLLADGQAIVRIPDFAPLGDLAGVKVKGGMDGDVVLVAKSGRQTADANVRKFEVAYEDYKAVMKQPARLVWDGVKGSLSPFILDIGAGTVTAQGSMNADVVNARLTVADLDIEQFSDSDVVTGKVNLTATASGRSAAPVVVLAGRMKGATGEYPLDVTLNGDWRAGKLAVQAAGSSRDASATANVSVAGKLSLLPFEMGVGEGSALRGTVAAHVPLEMFNNLLWASRQQIGGLVSGNGTLGGTVGVPEVNGRFVLSNGRYTQSTSGICLQYVGAEIVGSRDRIEIRNLSSRDDDGGSLSGQGNLMLQGAMGLDAGIRFDHLRLFCGGLASGKVDGQVAARGTLADHTVSGDLTVGPLQVQIPGANNDTDIPQVETIRVKAGATEAAKAATITRLAVTVNAPQKIYVRGRGLDAEFGGKIVVGGTADAPLLNGSLKALRGQYVLLDRTLLLADSAVNFEGPIPPSPYLAVKATTTAQGTAITLSVTGTASKPQLVLSSDPPLPQDEALALLLFGRKLENISAFEALKLAQATRVLAGLDGGGPGILDKARQTLGVDTLDIGTGEDSGDVTVTTGKYLTDKIYLSVEQGAEPEDREVKTEIELLPSVTGNTTVDGVGNQSFGVEWKRDY